MTTPFCSQPQFNRDPEPLLHPSGRRTADHWGFGAHFEFEEGQSGPFGMIAKALHDPRPEHNVPQTNPTNPILREVRYGVNDKRFTHEEALAHYSRPDVSPVPDGWWYTEDQLEHAVIVLRRTIALRDSLIPVLVVLDEDEFDDEWEAVIA